jgi:hypothetical protein
VYPAGLLIGQQFTTNELSRIASECVRMTPSGAV